VIIILVFLGVFFGAVAYYYYYKRKLREARAAETTFDESKDAPLMYQKKNKPKGGRKQKVLHAESEVEALD
jgi:cbb3-type cytochrome oxidase subunit 3